MRKQAQDPDAGERETLERVALKSYENYKRAERAERQVRALEGKLHEAAQAFGSQASDDAGEQKAYARAFESDPGKTIREFAAVANAEQARIAHLTGVRPEEVI